MNKVNQVDDDLTNFAKTFLNQNQNVVASGTDVPTSLSSLNVATGTVASPGPAGFGGADRPGRRIFNPLSKLASYTYNLTLYMITPDAYDVFIESGRQKIDALSLAATANSSPNGLGPGAYIIAQSGGVNNTTSKRAPGFNLDFYLDNLSLKTFCSTKSNESSTGSTTEISFTITEPYGFSFISNLRKAGAQLAEYASAGNEGYKLMSNQLKQFFILGIRFYGYDKEGNIVTRNSNIDGSPIDMVGAGNSDALFENFYDIQITSLKFKLDGKATVYSIVAASVPAQSLLGIKRGRIPTGVQISGSTVKDALIGNNGLFTVLNKQQQDLLDKKSITYANTYKVEFIDNAAAKLGNASLVTDADLSKWRWGGHPISNTLNVNELQGTAPPDNNTRLVAINNDTSVLMALDQIVKTSAFMANAMTTIYVNTKEPDYKQKNLEQTKNENPETLCWYTVFTESRNPRWDPKIQDWAYDLVYKIQLYDIPSISTPYAKNQQRYYGPHKRYDYWFTGKNSEIIDLNLQFDNLYFNAVLGLENSSDFKLLSTESNDPGAQRNEQNNTQGQGSGSSTNNTSSTSNNTGLRSDASPITKQDTAAGTATDGGLTSVTVGVRTGGDKTGGLGTSLEAQNSITTYLNDTGAFAKCVMKILGDPDFLIRDASNSLNDVYNKFYDTDQFTINAQGGQVFVEVAFKEAKDYNTDTGLMDLNENIFFVNYPPYIKEMTKGAVIWLVTDVKSTFSNGKFEQQITMQSPTLDGIGPAVGPPAEDPNYITGKQLSGSDPDNPVTVNINNQNASFSNNAPNIPPPKMNAGVLGSSTDSILNNTDNFGRPINTFGQR